MVMPGTKVSSELPEGYVASTVRPERGYIVRQMEHDPNKWGWFIYHDGMPIDCGQSVSRQRATDTAIAGADRTDEEMSFMEAKQRLFQIGITMVWKTFGEEYRVTHRALSRSRQEDVAYYSSDIYDCFCTGQEMYKRLVDNKEIVAWVA